MVAKMTTRRTIQIWASAFACLTLCLTGCSPRPVTAVQPVQSANPDIKATRGVIVAARPAVLRSAQGSTENSVVGVLAALHQSLTLPSSVNATEFIIQRSDATTAAMVIPVQTPVDNFSVGQRVEIIDGAEPDLVPEN
jgi:hypothetical protein